MSHTNFSAADGLDEQSSQHSPLVIESMDLEAQGIAHKQDGKVVFVEGALPFEWVSVNVHRKKNNWELGTVKAIQKESSQRVQPQCVYFLECIREHVVDARCSISTLMRRLLLNSEL